MKPQTPFDGEGAKISVTTNKYSPYKLEKNETTAQSQGGSVNINTFKKTTIIVEDFEYNTGFDDGDSSTFCLLERQHDITTEMTLTIDVMFE